MREASSKSQKRSGLIGYVLNDRYKIVAPIARGGMGKVYRAEQMPIGRPVALKILDPKHDTEADPEFHKRFLLEAATVARLSHPNTVTFFDYGHSPDGIYFIAMELVEGRTLAAVLKNETYLVPKRAVHVAAQICRSLREAHGLGVIHRDLKPANVVLTRHGDEEDFVKVLDFGLVKDVLSESEEELTKAGVFMGSPKYMSPEQINGKEVDPRADIYSLGVLLYQMLVGELPFDGPTPVHTLMMHINEPVPAMGGPGRPEVPEAVEQVVLKCLEKDRESRWPSMNELLDALKSAGATLGEEEEEPETDRGAFTAEEADSGSAAFSQTHRVSAESKGRFATGRPAASDLPHEDRGDVLSSNDDTQLMMDGMMSYGSRRRPLALWIALGILLLAGIAFAAWRSSAQQSTVEPESSAASSNAGS